MQSRYEELEREAILVYIHTIRYDPSLLCSKWSNAECQAATDTDMDSTLK